jgi:tRNA-(ms[2]io[6]A)-hydroxylase
MLGLRTESNPEWLQRVKDNTAVLLVDHAHCEKKAATMAISLLNRYPRHRDLVETMSALAIEEMSHFRMVLDEMDKRSISFDRDPGDSYAQALHTQVRKQEPFRLLDLLLVASLIEARSCERFRLLSESVADQNLAEFYRSLLASEARHRNDFIRLAKLYFDENVVDTRLDELETFEASIVQALPSHPLMHG